MESKNSDKYALIGQQISHSLSPHIHMEFAKQFALNIEYKLIEANAENFRFKIEEFFANGGKGLNLTSPLKQVLINDPIELSTSAQATQAINTLTVKSNGTLYGDNTDGIGFALSLQQHQIELQNKNILILGAGGAVRGIMPQIIQLQPARIMVANRSLTRAQHLSNNFRNGRIEVINDFSQITKVDLIINAIPGLENNAFIPMLNMNLANAIFYDLNYGQNARSIREKLLSKGFEDLIDGTSMLIEQAAAAFYLWHNMQPITAGIYRDLANIPQHCLI